MMVNDRLVDGAGSDGVPFALFLFSVYRLLYFFIMLRC